MTLPGNEQYMAAANNWVDDSALAELRGKTFPPHTVVFPKVGAAVHTNKKRLLSRESLIDNNVMGVIVRDTEACSPDFLYWWFRFINISELSNPGPLPSITATAVKAVQVPLPPLPEQRAIAHVLRTVERAKEATEKVIAATRTLKQSLMRHLFTYGPVPFDQADQVELKETEIGETPKHWEVTTLEDVSEFLQYGTSKRCHLEPTGTPVLRIPNVIGDVIDTTDLKYIELGQTETEKLLLAEGDLLFVRTNGRREYVGRCAVYQGEPANSLFASYLIRSRLRQDYVLPRFVQMYSTTAAGRMFLSGRASGAADGKFNINTKILKQVMLPRPDLEEQAEIVDFGEGVHGKEVTERNRLSALDALFTSLLHNLMTGKVRVHDLAESAVNE